MSNTGNIRLDLEGDLFRLQCLLTAMQYALGESYWTEDESDHERQDALHTLILYAQGLREDLAETAANLSYKASTPSCQVEATSTKESTEAQAQEGGQK